MKAYLYFTRWLRSAILHSLLSTIGVQEHSCWVCITGMASANLVPWNFRGASWRQLWRPPPTDRLGPRSSTVSNKQSLKINMNFWHWCIRIHYHSLLDHRPGSCSMFTTHPITCLPSVFIICHLHVIYHSSFLSSTTLGGLKEPEAWLFAPAAPSWFKWNAVHRFHALCSPCDAGSGWMSMRRA